MVNKNRTGIVAKLSWLPNAALLCGAMACSGPAAVATSSKTSMPAVTEAPSSAGSIQPCATPQGVERLEISANDVGTTATGLGIDYKGASHDNYEDGRTDVLLSLVYSVKGKTAQPRLVSMFADRSYEEILGYCVRIGKASEKSISIDVALAKTL